MEKIVIFGNSGSGKSTLAKTLCRSESLQHLDLDSLAWKAVSPPERKSIAESRQEIEAFVSLNKSWVIEGCYSDLLALVMPFSSEIIFLDLPVEACIANARKRTWEPHKYESKEAQDANLNMLVDWIAQYPHRSDTFSRSSHEALFNGYSGRKRIFKKNNQQE
ncbi:shikimate kinase [Endozoicomonas elysicola]|uniref:Shikimate kinase n=1 Tax=Endozoicomonas elysicola TaxID=305900 RepID=A0A081KDL5_9GAMM|nr:AAA family ATPase [Endozoicomonas elysicola]KEI72241.1 shikimate kinase [Endozoicomonas elysicola]